MNFRKLLTFIVVITVIVGCVCDKTRPRKIKNNKNTRIFGNNRNNKTIRINNKIKHGINKNGTVVKISPKRKKLVEKIVGGLKVKIEDFPYVMFFDSGMATTCGATIISSTLGITSAICCFKY